MWSEPAKYTTMHEETVLLNSEADASEFPENLEEMFPVYWQRFVILELVSTRS